MPSGCARMLPTMSIIPKWAPSGMFMYFILLCFGNTNPQSPILRK